MYPSDAPTSDTFLQHSDKGFALAQDSLSAFGITNDLISSHNKVFDVKGKVWTENPFANSLTKFPSVDSILDDSTSVK